MEAQAWVGKCDGCGLYCVLYEEAEFVCGKCHGAINPGNAIGEAVDQALTTLFEHNLPTTAVLAALWRGPGVAESLMRVVDSEVQYPDMMTHG
jgi:hypothetical protein